MSQPLELFGHDGRPFQTLVSACKSSVSADILGSQGIYSEVGAFFIHYVVCCIAACLARPEKIDQIESSDYVSGLLSEHGLGYLYLLGVGGESYPRLRFGVFSGSDCPISEDEDPRRCFLHNNAQYKY